MLTNPCDSLRVCDRLKTSPTAQESIMTVRAKFTLTAITSHAYGGKTLRFQAVYDQSIPDDRRFQKATPSGTFEMTVDNPAALEQFVLGRAYYFDATPA
jgi:hypothetical protein